LERGTCHTLWHRLDLDFVSDDSNAGRLSAYTCGSTASTAYTSGIAAVDALVACQQAGDAVLKSG
jgi:hypothetical protein